MFCHKCGHEILDEAVICVHCGCMVKSPTAQKPPLEDKVNPLWMILSILVPLAGIIYGAINFKEIPNTAKAYILAGALAATLSFFVLGSYMF